jgi:hypothetical protein
MVWCLLTHRRKFSQLLLSCWCSYPVTVVLSRLSFYPCTSKSRSGSPKERRHFKPLV